MFLYEHDYIVKFSNLDYYTSNFPRSSRQQCLLKLNVVVNLKPIFFNKQVFSRVSLRHGGNKEKETQLCKTAVFRQLVFSTRES